MHKQTFFTLPSIYRKQLAAAKQEHVQADALFASIGDGAIATNKDGKIQRVNAVALRILGYKKKDLINKWLPGILIEQDEDGNIIDPMERHLTRSFLTGKPISGKVFYQRKDHTAFPASVTISPIILNDKPVGSITVFRDISIEHEIDRMKSEFISIASHQLRTPLTAIKTYTHLLLDGYTGQLNQDQREFLNEIIDSANTMNELITNLLNVSRIELGKFKIDTQNITLNRLVERVVVESQPWAAEKNVDLSFMRPEKTYTVESDRFLLREVFVNLISNAIKYTPEHGKIIVRLDRKPRAVVFSVTDSGMGIPADVGDKIFSKFYRAPNAVRQETDGTGLGLYLIKLIAGALGARVWFESVEAKGSTFYFSVPVKKERAKRY